MLELKYSQLLTIASWPASPEVDLFRSGLGKLIAKGELIQVEPAHKPQEPLGKYAA